MIFWKIFINHILEKLFFVKFEKKAILKMIFWKFEKNNNFEKWFFGNLNWNIFENFEKINNAK